MLPHFPFYISAFYSQSTICPSIATACGRTRPATSCTGPFRKSTDGTRPTARRASSLVSVPAFSLSAHYKNVFAVVLVIKLRPTPLWNAKGCPTGKASPHMAAGCYDAETPYRRNADADILARWVQVRPPGSPHGCHLPFHAHPQCPFIPFRPFLQYSSFCRSALP